MEKGKNEIFPALAGIRETAVNHHAIQNYQFDTLLTYTSSKKKETNKTKMSVCKGGEALARSVM